MVPIVTRSLFIQGFPNYSISEMGDIYNVNTGRKLSISHTKTGLSKISLVGDDHMKHTIGVAAAMVEAFGVEPDTEFCDTPTHKNGDKTDLRLVNLTLRPHWYATKYHKERQEEQPPLDASEVGPVVNVNTGVRYETYVEAANACGVLYSDFIHALERGTPVPYVGYTFG